tara:strand:- start:5578 stop:5856 length:279 start_codon:yes stop_codon:yes gene_type:complete
MNLKYKRKTLTLKKRLNSYRIYRTYWWHQTKDGYYDWALIDKLYKFLRYKDNSCCKLISLGMYNNDNVEGVMERYIGDKVLYEIKNNRWSKL